MQMQALCSLLMQVSAFYNDGQLWGFTVSFLKASVTLAALAQPFSRTCFQPDMLSMPVGLNAGSTGGNTFEPLWPVSKLCLLCLLPWVSGRRVGGVRAGGL